MVSIFQLTNVAKGDTRRMSSQNNSEQLYGLVYG